VPDLIHKRPPGGAGLIAVRRTSKRVVASHVTWEHGAVTAPTIEGLDAGAHDDEPERVAQQS